MTKKIKKGRPRGSTNLVPKLKIISGKSHILIAQSNARKLKNFITWCIQPKDDENPFTFVQELPTGDSDDIMLVNIPVGQKQAQAIYEAFSKRVPVSELPPECPIKEINGGRYGDSEE